MSTTYLDLLDRLAGLARRVGASAAQAQTLHATYAENVSDIQAAKGPFYDQYGLNFKAEFTPEIRPEDIVAQATTLRDQSVSLYAQLAEKKIGLEQQIAAWTEMRHTLDRLEQDMILAQCRWRERSYFKAQTTVTLANGEAPQTRREKNTAKDILGSFGSDYLQIGSDLGDISRHLTPRLPGFVKEAHDATQALDNIRLTLRVLERLQNLEKTTANRDDPGTSPIWKELLPDVHAGMNFQEFRRNIVDQMAAKLARKDDLHADQATLGEAGQLSSQQPSRRWPRHTLEEILAIAQKEGVDPLHDAKDDDPSIPGQ